MMKLIFETEVYRMTMRNMSPWRGRQEMAKRERAGSPLDSLHQQMDRLFEDFFGEGTLMPFGGLEAGTFIPRVEMKEDDKQIQVTAELPGVDENDIRVSATDEVLSIEGEKKSEVEEKEKGLYRSERFYGSFRRELSLPKGIEINKIEASFKNGVLKLTLPKTEQAQKTAKSIPIKKVS
jgi:HSP20 family protein